MKHFTTLVIVFLFSSCGLKWSVSGRITDIGKDNVVTLDSNPNKRFKMLNNDSVYIGRFVSFSPTGQQLIVNSKRIKNDSTKDR